VKSSSLFDAVLLIVIQAKSTGFAKQRVYKVRAKEDH
jgi:hypothetical protein